MPDQPTEEYPQMSTGGICTVPECGEIVAEAFVCSTCTHRLSVALGDVADLAEELQTDLTRQGRRGGRDGGRDAEAPLPFDVGASIVADALLSTLTSWALIVAGDLLGTPPATGAAGLASWLGARVERIRHRPDGGVCVDEVCAAIEAARDQVHGPARGPNSLLLGVCPECGQALYGRERVRQARCRRDGCDGVVDAAEWRYDALQQLAEEVLPAVDAARAASVFLGVDISAARVRQWRRRGRLAPVDPDASRPLYRVAEVCRLLDVDTRQTAS
ncbi:hypothetical protein [Nocardiopsis salina]|uniref:hypothetical protein n=1 Tax=Nocardiopsis salina TaxID=245836 RepID=UPI00035E0D88|nr:hypothetical protein [Nocardiopsis salina]